MTTYELDQTDLRGDGRVILYKRPGLKRPKWQARISVPNSTGYKIVSTKTTEFEEAKRFALNLYEELYMQVKAGGALNTKTFKQVCADWKEHATTVGHTRSQGSWDTTIDRIETYALPFFGAKRIDEIKESDFTEYWAWRKVNYRKRPPTNQTLKREKTCILPVFKFAVSKGYLTKIPEMNAPNAKGERRPTFTTKEWKAIRDAMPVWLEEATELATWRDRFMAMHCFLLLANSGLRIGELRKLTWRDVSSVKAKGAAAYYILQVTSGKTGARQCTLTPGTDVTLRKVYMQRCRELRKQFPDQKDAAPSLDEPIFAHPNGNPIREFKTSFHSLLEFAGVPIEQNGKARTIYSLRHFYATRQLSKEASPFLIAHQMGTSVEMLEKHYGQIITGTVAEQINKAKAAHIAFDTDVEFPF